MAAVAARRVQSLSDDMMAHDCHRHEGGEGDRQAKRPKVGSRRQVDGGREEVPLAHPDLGLRRMFIGHGEGRGEGHHGQRDRNGEQKDRGWQVEGHRSGSGGGTRDATYSPRGQQAARACATRVGPGPQKQAPAHQADHRRKSEPIGYRETHRDAT